MEKYMKFPMFEKETKDKKYHEDPFRAVNFKIDEDGVLRCPNGKRFDFAYRKAVRGNQYGRQEEVYICEDCGGCPYAAQCKKTEKSVQMEVFLISIGHNLYKYHNKQMRLQKAAW